MYEHLAQASERHCLARTQVDLARTQVDLAHARILDLERRVREAESMATRSGCFTWDASQNPHPTQRPALQESLERSAPFSERLARRVCSSCVHVGHAAPKHVYAAYSLLGAPVQELAAREARKRGGNILARLACVLTGPQTDMASHRFRNEAVLDAPWVYVEAGGASSPEGRPGEQESRDALSEDEWCTADEVSKR